MYPQRELTRLTAYKATLRRRIAEHRTQCVEASARVAQPLDLLDRMLTLWRRLSPLALFAAVPLVFHLKRTASPKLKILGALVRWSPLIFTAVRRISSAVTTRFAAAKT